MYYVFNFHHSFVKILEDKKKFIVAKQLLRSATAIGASVMEAESKADFIHKLKIADKECLETWYWLVLCNKAEDYPFDTTLYNQVDEIRRLLNAIIKSVREKINSVKNQNR